MNLHFIVNPVAENGQANKIWKKVKIELDKHEIHYVEHFTKYRGDGKNISEAILKNTDEQVLIVAVGGDGTVKEVVNGVYPYKNGIIGVIPAGSGNDFCRGFSIPKNPKQALEKILFLNEMRQDYQQVDVGSYSTDLESGVFMNNLGCGFDAMVAQNANASPLKPLLNRLSLGKLIYAFYLIMELFHFHPKTITLEVDKKKIQFENAWFATVTNISYFGGGMKISPESRPDDGIFEVIVIHNISRIKIILLFITVFWGGHTKMKEVAILKGTEITLFGDPSFPLHADGELIGMEKAKILLYRNKVKLLANS